MADLTLASASESRRAMLEKAGITVKLCPVRIDEAGIRDSLQAEGAKPRDVADALAEYKARRASDKAEGPRILAADQVLELDGTMFSKPESHAHATEQLQQLRGRQHRLFSAAVIYEGHEPVWRHVGEARLTMLDLSDKELAAYLDRAWPEVSSSVGAYHAEALGARLFSRIDGDWFSVLGLPLLPLLNFLRMRGWIDL